MEQVTTSPHDSERLLRTLQQLLEIEATDVERALNEASDLLGLALRADKVDVFLFDAATDELVALGVSDTAMSEREVNAGLDRLPLVSGGRITAVFQTGQPFRSGHADTDGALPAGFSRWVGVRSALAASLLFAGERRGVLIAYAGKPDFFSAADLGFLAAVARWVGGIAHRAELVQRIADQAAQEGRRMAAEELMSVLAHDLGNYLTPLFGRMNMIRRRAAREGLSRYEEDAGAALRELERLRQMIADLTDATRLEQGLFGLNLQDLDLAALVRETAASMEGPDVPVAVNAPAALTIAADPARLRQVLENLLANALRYSPEGKPAAISLTEEIHPGERWAVLTVADEGSGIPPDVLPRLFTRFARGQESSGLGLGLYLAHGIAAAHGGTLTADSPLGHGARFTLRLPERAGD